MQAFKMGDQITVKLSASEATSICEGAVGFEKLLRDVIASGWEGQVFDRELDPADEPKSVEGASAEGEIVVKQPAVGESDSSVAGDEPQEPGG